MGSPVREMSTSVRTTRALVAPLGLALAATTALAGSGLPAAADPTSAPRFDQSSGRGPDSVTRVEEPTKAEVVQRAAETAVAGDPIEMPTSYPYQPALRLYRDNPDDAAHTAELIGHPEIAPKLMEVMAKRPPSASPWRSRAASFGLPGSRWAIPMLSSR